VTTPEDDEFLDRKDIRNNMGARPRVEISFWYVGDRSRRAAFIEAFLTVEPGGRLVSNTTDMGNLTLAATGDLDERNFDFLPRITLHHLPGQLMVVSNQVEERRRV